MSAARAANAAALACNQARTGFGASGPAEVLYKHFGITPEAIVAEARRLLATHPETATV
jgi:transketolase